MTPSHVLRDGTPVAVRPISTDDDERLTRFHPHGGGPAVPSGGPAVPAGRAPASRSRESIRSHHAQAAKGPEVLVVHRDQRQAAQILSAAIGPFAGGLLADAIGVDHVLATLDALHPRVSPGGFVIVDDFKVAGYGFPAGGGWDNFEDNMRHVLPDVRFYEMNLSHPIFHSFFDIKFCLYAN